MPHILVAGKLHPSGIALLKARADVTFDYVEEVTVASYLPLVAAADGLVIRTQPLTAATITGAKKIDLAPECAAWVGGEDPHLRQRESDDLGDRALQQVRVLHRGVDVESACVGRHGHRAAGLDREVRHHRERVGVLHDHVGGASCGGRVAPLVQRGLQDVGGPVRVVLRAQCGVADQGGAGSQGLISAE